MLDLLRTAVAAVHGPSALTVLGRVRLIAASSVRLPRKFAFRVRDEIQGVLARRRAPRLEAAHVRVLARQASDLPAMRPGGRALLVVVARDLAVPLLALLAIKFTSIELGRTEDSIFPSM